MELRDISSRFTDEVLQINSAEIEVLSDFHINNYHSETKGKIVNKFRKLFNKKVKYPDCRRKINNVSIIYITKSSYF